MAKKKRDVKTLYGLIDPLTGAIRYVGATIDVKARYQQHKSASRGANKKVGKWIRELKKKGEVPDIIILDRVPRGEHRWREKDLENTFRLLGFRTGYHILNGGRAPVKRDESREPSWAKLWFWKCACGKRFPQDGRSLKEQLLRVENPIAPGERDFFVCPGCGREGGFKTRWKDITWPDYWSDKDFQELIDSS